MLSVNNVHIDAWLLNRLTMFELPTQLSRRNRLYHGLIKWTCFEPHKLLRVQGNKHTEASNLLEFKTVVVKWPRFSFCVVFGKWKCL